MAFVVFALSLILLVAGLASSYMSLDLLPTGAGLLYALGGAVAVSMAFVSFALGVLIGRIDKLTELVRQPPQTSLAPGPIEPLPQAFDAPPVELEAPAEDARAGQVLAQEFEEPVNANRAGHLPTFRTIEHVFESPEPSSVVGRYSAGGANYMIFDDGSIEAETGDGTFKFASMADFRRYLADHKSRA